jgi:hypothetical protein
MSRATVLNYRTNRKARRGPSHVQLVEGIILVAGGVPTAVLGAWLSWMGLWFGSANPTWGPMALCVCMVLTAAGIVHVVMGVAVILSGRVNGQ